MICAAEATSYQVPDKHTGVTSLLNSMQTQHSQLQYAKVTIENKAAKRNDFEVTADFLCKLVPKRDNSTGGLHRISSMVTTMKSEFKDLEDVQVDVGYYKPEEWNILTNNHCQKCILSRRIQLE